jgi:hypothetical protein
MGSATLQTLQDPILLMSGSVCDDILLPRREEEGSVATLLVLMPVIHASMRESPCDVMMASSIRTA